MYIVYALYNAESDKIYIGQTNNFNNRLKRHNGELTNKKASYTNLNHGKWELVYKEEYQTRKDVLVRESQLKSQKGREFIWKIIKKDTNNLVAVAQR